MRQIEEQMVQAVNERRNFKKSNTEVRIDGNTVKVLLFGHCIYTNCNGIVRVSLCGWNTPTTRSRLNALSVNVIRRNNQPLLNGEVINERMYHRVKPARA